MKSWSTLRVVKVLLDQDLRQIHTMRERVRCKDGECWLFINSALSMARIGLGNGMLLGYWHHDYYPGEEIDPNALIEQIGALRLRLVINADDQRRIGKFEVIRKAA